MLMKAQEMAREARNVQPYKDLRGYLAQVEALGELHRIDAEVDWNEEMGATTYMMARSETEIPPALMFENIKGYSRDYRVLFYMIGSSKRRVALSLGLDPELSIREMVSATRHLLDRKVAPVQVDAKTAPVNENVYFEDTLNVLQFPSVKVWPLDGGRYLATADCVIARDPELGHINVGTYRGMVLDEKRMIVYCSPGKDLLLIRQKYWAQGKPCPVAIVAGVDPRLLLVGSQTFPKNVSELDYAGGLLGEGIEVFESEITGLPIPARSEIVLEGLCWEGKKEMEGPFGEFTGFYGRPAGLEPVIEIKAIRHRNKPIVTAALMADYHAQETALMLAIVRSAKVWNDLDNMGIPGINGVYAYPAAAAGLGMVVVSVTQKYAGHVAQVLAMAAQCTAAAFYTKWVVAVDDDVDPTDVNQVLWALSTRCNPSDAIDILRNTWSTYLDPARNPPEVRPYGSKALINACMEHRYIKSYSKKMKLRESMYQQVKNRWSEFRLPGKPPEISTFEDFSGQDPR